MRLVKTSKDNSYQKKKCPILLFVRALFSRNRANALSWLASNFKACDIHCAGKNWKYQLISRWNTNNLQSLCAYNEINNTRHWQSRVYSPGWVGEASPRAVHLSFSVNSPEHEWQIHGLLHLESHSPAASEQSVEKQILYNHFTVSSIYTALSVLLDYCNRYWQGIIKLQLLIQPIIIWPLGYRATTSASHWTSQ